MKNYVNDHSMGKEIKAWISVAIELGLLEETSRNMKFEEQLGLLQELVENNTEEKVIKSDGIIKSSEEMVMLREKENDLPWNLQNTKIAISKCLN